MEVHRAGAVEGHDGQEVLHLGGAEQAQAARIPPLSNWKTAVVSPRPSMSKVFVLRPLGSWRTPREVVRSSAEAG